uniref:Uncharacterized protein n=1 Tax=Kwoniella dejecticola CBS 10117 TaxID=1296121 RepID=A0A1A6AGE4_9TREE|nr:uncharacterized protein I303_00920 [Kwoniella dejecticola CBS 10117]OBR89098.1 hypothetical protein I303_00920 [Kwoniella dejecticola CBS 10117]
MEPEQQTERTSRLSVSGMKNWIKDHSPSRSRSRSPLRSGATSGTEKQMEKQNTMEKTSAQASEHSCNNSTVESVKPSWYNSMAGPLDDLSGPPIGLSADERTPTWEVKQSMAEYRKPLAAADAETETKAEARGR